MPDDRQKGLLTIAVPVRSTMLHVNDADNLPAGRNNRNREKSFKLVFRQRVEELESRVFCRMARNGDRLSLLRHPPGDAFAHLHRDAPDQPRMRVF